MELEAAAREVATKCYGYNADTRTVKVDLDLLGEDAMRPVREITADEENFRLEPTFPGTADSRLKGMSFTKRDPVKPEPEGTIVLMAFRVTGYDEDCDGSLMARLEQMDKDGDATGWKPTHIGLYSECDLVVSAEEWQAMFDS